MLTKDAKSCLFILYQEYMSRISNGFSRSDAKNFDSADSVKASLFPDRSLDDIEDILRELGRNGFLSNFYADNTILNFELTDYALMKMENQRKETLLSIADFVSKFIP